MRRGYQLIAMLATSLRYAVALLAGCFVASPSSAFAEEAQSACARVKIEIQQELTLERQAFDAHMRITNGLDQIGIENVRVVVSFLDESGNSVHATSDPHDTSALFFFRVSSTENIGSVDGTGVVQPLTFADIHWLIIPASGASKGQPQGTLYYVGATLSYTLGGEPHSTEVNPDYIFVKPMPEMALDYFVQEDVYGDDPFTTGVEPPVPFSLGVRVKNSGFGTARQLKIDSAQPKIVEKGQGLLIDFTITGSEVNGKEATKSLLVDFGDIAPGASAIARWIMTCSLSGKFVEFNAEFSHADDLGGEVTSLMDSINTHLLVRDILVDFPGRDSIRDFLAKDGDVIRVYESEGVDTVAVNHSASSSLRLESRTDGGASYTLSCPATVGFVFVQLDDPEHGALNPEITRSDGKRIKPENGWVSKIRNPDHSWHFFLNLLDANTTGSYTVTYGSGSPVSHPPVLDFIPDQKGTEGSLISFEISATDPEGTLPALSGSPLPALATFTDRNDGTGRFTWTPAPGQTGRYEITFKASDGSLTSSQRMLLKVCPQADSDCDGMTDAWEVTHFGTLDRDGTGDADGDGVSDLDEFLKGTDPNVKNVPTLPRIASPEEKGETAELHPDLCVFNSTDPDGDPITYAFELYSDPSLTTLLASESALFEGSGTTCWTVPLELSENTWYTWRVRASDGKGVSEWVNGSFFVNAANDPPGSFTAGSPMDGSEVDSLTPILSTNGSADPDDDALTYTFEVYADPELAVLVASGVQGGAPAPKSLKAPSVLNARSFLRRNADGAGGLVSWTVNVSLKDNTRYFWRVLALDGHGASSVTPVFSFFVNTANDAPSVPEILSPLPGSEVSSEPVDLIAGNSVDIDGDLLTYRFELDTVPTFDSPAHRVSDPVSEGEGETGYTVSGLSDNTLTFWRVRASDGAAQSPWATGSFFVNTANDLPSTPVVKNPGEGAWVTSLTPALELAPSIDPDRDALSYAFELYEGKTFSMLQAQGTADEPRWTVPFELSNDSWYGWRAQAIDEHGAASPWVSATFFTDNNGIDDPPELLLETPSQDLYTRGEPIEIGWQDRDPDSSAAISLGCTADSGASFPIASNLPEDPDGSEDRFLWDTAPVPEGLYTITGSITDGHSTSSSTAPGRVMVDRTAPSVSADPPGGTYTAPQSVSLTASEPATIYYTIDGSDPTASSPQYGVPIEITQSTTLKFQAIDAAGNASPVLSQIYVIEEEEERVVISGVGEHIPQGASDRAHFTFLFRGPLDPKGVLEYHYLKREHRKFLLVEFLCTRVTSLTVQGKTADIEGKGRMLGKPGYTFRVSVTDGSPDLFGITILRPDGTVFFSTGPTALRRGKVTIRTLEGKK